MMCRRAKFYFSNSLCVYPVFPFLFLRMCLPVIRETTIPFNGADCLIQLGQMEVEWSGDTSARIGLQRYRRGAWLPVPRPDLRADLQIGGYCAPRGNQTVL